MVLELEGKSYLFVTRSTIERDVRLSNVLRESGCQDAMVAALGSGEDVDAAIFRAVTGSGKLFEILGCALVPEGTDPIDWSPALARETTDTLKRITADKAKAVLLESVVGLVRAFFLAGLHSLATSPRYSEAKRKSQPATANAATTSSATGA